MMDEEYERRICKPQGRNVQPFPFLELKDKLPRLPIPPLQETAKKYLNYLQPLLSPTELQRTAELVDEFVKGEGPNLQEELIRLDKESPTSWLEGWWDTGYVEFRVPCPINVNPFFILRNDPTRPSQVKRAAQFTLASLRFYDRIRTNQLSHDKEGDVPLCMTQYGRLFATCRLPVSGRDTVYSFTDSRHIIVAANRQFFSVNVLGDKGEILPQGSAYLVATLETILQRAREGDAVPVGILTSEHRDTWAAARKNLEVSRVNHESLHLLDTALFILVLEDIPGGTLQAAAPLMLHSDGRTRWFDKIQLIVCQDGLAGVNMEHAPLDGHTALRFLTDASAEMLSWKGELPGGSTPVPAGSVEAGVKKLQWEVPRNSPAALAIKTAESNFDAFVSHTETQVLEFVMYGGDQIKSWGFSPDGFVQTAYQLAYFMLKGHPASTYESAQTKRFYHGRTETLRAVTNESVAFTKIFTSPEASEQQKLEALKKAVAAHGQRAKESKEGKGVDRHWLGLKSVALHKQQRYPGYLLPRMFVDPAYPKLMRSVISTSNCGGTALVLFGFGPVVDEGLGIGYMIHQRAIHFCVTSFQKEAAPFVAHMIHALIDMKEIAEKNKKSGPAGPAPQQARL